MAGFLEFSIELATFAAVTLGALMVFGFVERRQRIHGRMSPAVVAATPSPAGELVVSTKIENRFLRWIRGVTLEKSGEEHGLRRKLVLAGFTDPAAPVWYVIIRLVAAIAPPVIFVLVQGVAAKPMTGSIAVMAPAILCLIGFLTPQAVVDNLSGTRKEKLVQQFPDALDLLVICVEAGAGLEAAIVRVSQETAESHPEIAREFVRLSQEVGAGRSRDEALQAMGERTDVDIIRSFGAIVAQSDALGVGIGQTLRTFALEMRETRYINAEEKAMRIPVLMTVPLVAFILPVIVTALLLPAVIDVVRAVGPSLAGR
jgi:tight adherence protein C